MTLDDKTRNALVKRAAAVRRSVYRRNEDILQAVADGASLREVAAAVGLSHSAVDRIVKKGDGAR